MDLNEIKLSEKKMRKDNALSMFSKMFVGTIIILTVGFLAFALLVALMLML